MAVISIIYPVFNVEQYLEKSLQSLLNQDFVDFEIVAVNDGSTDGSAEILAEFADKDDRIKVYNQENQGVAKARMNALKKAAGEYVCFVDSDDILPENSLSVLYNALINNDADVAEGNYCKVFPDGAVVDFEFPPSGVVAAKENIDMLLSSKVLYSLCAKLFTTRLFDNAALQDFVFMEDVCLTLQAVAQADRVVLVNQCVYQYVQHKGSAVHSHFYDKGTADYYLARLWIADYLRKNFGNFFEKKLEVFILQGFAYTICLGGKRFLKKEDVLNCKKIFTNCKRCLPIGQRAVVQTVNIPVVNNLLIKFYQIRIRFSKR